MSSDLGRPGFGELVEWLEGRLDPGTAEQVAAQVTSADERTRRTVEWLRGFLVTARALPLRQPPPIVRQSLDQYFGRWSRAQAELGQQPRAVHARLLFDSRQDLALAGVRAGAGEDDVFHLAYTSGEGDLLVDVYRLGTGLIRLDGQVVLEQPLEAPVFEASVAGPDFTVRTRRGDELGRFSLTDVPARHCQLQATNGLVTIVAELDLGPGGDQP